MAKVWTYTPNQYTTGMTFTVTFSGGSRAVFTYTVSNSVWSLTDGSTGDLVVTTTDRTISITDDGHVKKIEADCFNSSMHNDGPTINVKQIVFFGRNEIAQYDSPASTGSPKVGKVYGLNDEMWFYFGNPDPVTFTNLTEQIELPALRDVFGNFHGYAILNCTADPMLGDYASVQIDGNNFNGHAKCVWAFYQNYLTRIVKRDSTGEPYAGRGLDFLDSDTTLENFSYDGTYYAIPLYHDTSAVNTLYRGVVDETRHGAIRELQSILDELGAGTGSLTPEQAQ